MENLTDNEVFLLHYLNHREINWSIDSPVIDLFSNIDDTISKLKNLGYLQDDNHIEFLREGTVKDLKQILKDLGLKTSGNKESLVLRVIENTTIEQRASISSTLYYSLTTKGKDVDNKYKLRRKEESEKLKRNMARLIHEDEYQKAVNLMGRVYSSYPIPPGIGTGWSDPATLHHVASTALKTTTFLDFSDLSNSDNYKQILRKIMFFEETIGHNISNSIDMFSDYLNEALKCQKLEDFLFRKNANLDKITERVKISIYLSTKRYIYNSQSLDNNWENLKEGDFLISSLYLQK